MSVKISELPLLSTLSDNDVIAGVDTSADATKKIELSTLKEYTNANIDLTDYVQNTDYATSSTGGVIKLGGGLTLSGDGKTIGEVRNYATYQQSGDVLFISKGTLENVITGKDLTTKAYVDSLVGDINTALDTINGEIV